MKLNNCSRSGIAEKIIRLLELGADIDATEEADIIHRCLYVYVSPGNTLSHQVMLGNPKVTILVDHLNHRYVLIITAWKDCTDKGFREGAHGVCNGAIEWWCRGKCAEQGECSFR